MIAVIKYLKMYGRGVIFGLYDFRWGEIGSVAGSDKIDFS